MDAGAAATVGAQYGAEGASDAAQHEGITRELYRSTGPRPTANAGHIPAWVVAPSAMDYAAYAASGKPAAYRLTRPRRQRPAVSAPPSGRRGSHNRPAPLQSQTPGDTRWSTPPPWNARPAAACCLCDADRVASTANPSAPPTCAVVSPAQRRDRVTRRGA